MTYTPGAGAGLPNLPDNTEVASGRQISGQDTFFKLVRPAAGNLPTGSQNFAHGITGLDEIYELHGTTQRDNGSQLPLPFPSSSSTFVNSLQIDGTNLIVNIGTGFTGGGSTLSDPTFFLEYSKV